MKINKRQICYQWISAWNNHYLDEIMVLYGEKIEHTSPKIAEYFETENNTIKDKKLLREYFEKALKNNPELTFELVNIFEGQCSCVVIYYRNKEQLVSEYLEFDHVGKIIKSSAHSLSIENG